MNSSPSITIQSNKRHSLNPTSGPRPLQLVDGHFNSSFQSNPGPLSAPLAHSDSFPSSTPTTPSFGHKRPDNRRQSTIGYFAPDVRDSAVNILDAHPKSATAATTPNLARSRSLGVRTGAKVSGLRGDRRSAGALDSPRDRGPLTLVEKHADLLHFIAQKESKCLELRTQLAKEEEELLQLKHKWERIVNRGVQKAANGQTPTAIASNHRRASRNSIVDSPPPPPSASSSPRNSRVRGRGHASRQSNSSVSTAYTTTTHSTRFSHSSASSISLMGDDPSCQSPQSSSLTPHEEEECNLLMMTDTGATPTERSEASKTKVFRRRSRDQAQIRGLASPLSPIAVTADSAELAADSGTVKGTRKKRSTVGSMSGLPPPVSTPGLGPLVGMGATMPPMSSWMGSMGKKWEELQRGGGGTFPSSNKSPTPKRASILSDLFGALASPLPSPSLDPSPDSSPLTPALSPAQSQPHTRSRPQSVGTTSLLDDDGLTVGQSLGLGSVLTPDSRKPAAQREAVKSTTHTGEEDDEWNW